MKNKFTLWIYILTDLKGLLNDCWTILRKMENKLLPCFINSTLGDLEDLLEDLEDEFLLEAPVIEWVELAESNLLDLLFTPSSSSSSSSPWEEQEPDLLRFRLLRVSSRPRDSWNDIESSSGVRERRERRGGETPESVPELIRPRTWARSRQIWAPLKLIFSTFLHLVESLSRKVFHSLGESVSSLNTALFTFPVGTSFSLFSWSTEPLELFLLGLESTEVLVSGRFLFFKLEGKLRFSLSLEGQQGYLHWFPSLLPSFEHPSEKDPNCLSEDGVRVCDDVLLPCLPVESVLHPLSTFSSSELRWDAEDLWDSWLEHEFRRFWTNKRYCTMVRIIQKTTSFLKPNLLSFHNKCYFFLAKE